MDDTLGKAFEEILGEHGVEPTPELVSELVKAATAKATWLNATQIAYYVGTINVGSVGTWCSKRGVRREYLARADEVHAEIAKLPGRQGARLHVKRTPA
jgi:hypothetical protein